MRVKQLFKKYNTALQVHIRCQEINVPENEPKWVQHIVRLVRRELEQCQASK